MFLRSGKRRTGNGREERRNRATGGAAELCLLGDAVAHSLSPAFQNAALKAVGLPWRYVARRVLPPDLAGALEEMRHSGTIGANITVPHKIAALGAMDSLEREAGITGAVNTVLVRDGHLRGANTDVHGFLTALREVLPGGLSRPAAVILGAGGAARSVAWGLVEEELVDSLTVISRNLENGQMLINAVRHGQGRSGKRPIAFALVTNPEEVADDLFGGIGLVVNATPLGRGDLADRTPLPDPGRLSPDTLVFDLTYGPGPSRLLQESEAAGLPVSDGLGMLLHQGARSFELWTGLPAPIEVMRDALRHAAAEPAAEAEESR